jgi:phospholipase/carboxylesterase
MPRTLFSTLMLPTEGVYTSHLPQLSSRPVQTFLPTGYEPNYAYPLIVLFHPHGGNDEQVLRLAPRISRRNCLYISLQGPVPLNTQNEEGLAAYGWGEPGEHDTAMADYLTKAVEKTRREFHVHSERIYLAGIAEGAEVAYRMALRMPRAFAGVISINATVPRPAEGPLFRDDEVKDLRVLICHGAANEVVPLEMARRDFLALYGAGADVLLSTYPCTHTVHPNMLRDINRWVIRNVDQDTCWDADEEDFEE